MTWRVAILAFTIMLAGATAPLIRDAVGGRDGYRVMGVAMAVLIVRRRRVARTSAPAAPRSARSPREPARCASSCGSWRRPATSGCCSRRSSSRRWRPAACSPASTTSPRTCSAVSGAATILFVCFVGPALVLTPAWARSARASARSAATRLLAGAGAGAALGGARAVRPAGGGLRGGRPGGRGLRGLPGLPDGDAARRRPGSTPVRRARPRRVGQHRHREDLAAGVPDADQRDRGEDSTGGADRATRPAPRRPPAPATTRRSRASCRSGCRRAPTPGSAAAPGRRSRRTGSSRRAAACRARRWRGSRRRRACSRSPAPGSRRW